MLGDIIILHKCTKNHDHMLHCSWDTAHDRCNFYFSFQSYFLLFYLLTIPKIKILKKWKKRLEISSFYTCVPQIMTTMYSSWDMVRDGPKDGQKKWHVEVGAPPKKSVELQCKSIDWFLQNIRLKSRKRLSRRKLYVQNYYRNTWLMSCMFHDDNKVTKTRSMETFWCL